MGGPHIKEYSILGSILGSPNFGNYQIDDAVHGSYDKSYLTLAV